MGEFFIRRVRFQWDPLGGVAAFAIQLHPSLAWMRFRSWQKAIELMWPDHGWPLPWAPDVDSMDELELLALCRETRWDVSIYATRNTGRGSVCLHHFGEQQHWAGSPGEPWDLAALREAVRKALDAEGVARDV